MRTLISIFVFSMLASQTIGLSAAPNDEQSPKDLVERYFRVEAAGTYLGADGWYKGSDFFVHLGAPPKKVTISVISRDYSVWKPEISGDSARVIVATIVIGDIDSSLRFTESETIKGFVGYNLYSYQHVLGTRPARKKSASHRAAEMENQGHSWSGVPDARRSHPLRDSHARQLQRSCDSTKC